MKRIPLYLFLLLFTVSVANADDIATLQSFLDNKTDDQTVLHGVYTACLNLTRTGTEEAVPVLQQLLNDERFSTVARTALINIPGDAGRKALRESLETLQGKNRIAVIQTLGAIDDEESVPAIIKIVEETKDDGLTETGVRALGNIASPEAVIAIWRQLKLHGDSTTWSTEAAVNAVTRLEQDKEVPGWIMLHNRGPKAAISLCLGIAEHGNESGKNAANLALLLDRMKISPRLDNFFPNVNINGKVLLRAVLESDNKETGRAVLETMSHFPVEWQAALIRNLGARKDKAIVPRLMELVQNGQPALQLAAIEALGEIGDLRAVDAILPALTAENTELAEAAKESLKLFTGDQFDKKIIALLDSNDKKLCLAALDIIGTRQIAEAKVKLMAFFDDAHPDPGTEIRTAAYKAFATVAPASFHDVHFVYATLRSRVSEKGDQTPAREALLTLCRKTADRDEAVLLFRDAVKDFSSPIRDFYLDCLFQLGGEKAAAVIAAVAMGTDDALCDRATQLLGRWTTPDAAPHLILIAEKHPNERYRNRTLSGYLRVIRQMGLPLEQKVQMAEKAVAVASRDADKERAKEVLVRFRAMMKGTPIFDGKTFDGWEFRGNEEWFRIEDGAIVGGTLAKPIPRNEFIVSKKEYGDFTLRIECKAIGEGVNGGVQFRSVRAPDDSNMPNEMIGYQADMTGDAAYWGALYDESRRNRFLAEPDKALVTSIFRPNDWNEYEIVCKGSNVKIFLNGKLTVDYTEAEANIPIRGFIGLQIHSGPASETWYRNIRVEE